jgi:hypothetical protein
MSAMEGSKAYRHSGRFSGLGVARAFVAGILVAVPMAFVYAYAILYVPLVGTVTFVLTGGFAAVVGFVVGYLLHASKVRNQAVTAATAAVVALFTLWASWVVWLYALLHRADVDVGLLTLVTEPSALWKLVVAVNEQGAWNLHGFTPTGAILWGLWAIEAGIIVGGVVLVAWFFVSSPFCEACDAWSLEQKGLAVLGHTQKDALAPRLERGDYAVIGELPPPSDAAYTRFDLHACGSCDALNALTATAVTVTVKKGKADKSEKTLVKYLLLSARQLADVKRAMEEARAHTRAAAVAPEPA